MRSHKSQRRTMLLCDWKGGVLLGLRRVPGWKDRPGCWSCCWGTWRRTGGRWRRIAVCRRGQATGGGPALLAPATAGAGEGRMIWIAGRTDAAWIPSMRSGARWAQLWRRQRRWPLSLLRRKWRLLHAWAARAGRPAVPPLAEQKRRRQSRASGNRAADGRNFFAGRCSSTSRFWVGGTQPPGRLAGRFRDEERDAFTDSAFLKGILLSVACSVH